MINLRPPAQALLMAAHALLMVACQSGGGDRPELAAGPSGDEIRAAAAGDAGVIEVQPLRDPAVSALEDRALALEQQGQLDEALQSLKQALLIAPDDPQVLQRLAELALELGEYQQALDWAVKSYQRGPKVGSLCSRSLRTVDAARRALGENVQRNDYQVCQVQERKTL